MPCSTGGFDWPSMESIEHLEYERVEHKVRPVGTAGFARAKPNLAQIMDFLAPNPASPGGVPDGGRANPQSPESDVDIPLARRAPMPLASVGLGMFDDTDDEGDATPYPMHLDIVDLPPEVSEEDLAELERSVTPGVAEALYQRDWNEWYEAPKGSSESNWPRYQIDPTISPKAPPQGGKGHRSFSRSKHPMLSWCKDTFPSCKSLQDYVQTCESLSNMLQKMKLSVTIADPLQPNCPLVAASAGFCALTGYTQSEIVGRNCGFLHRGVPEHLICQSTKNDIREFIELCKSTRLAPLEARFFSQVNARVDGTLFTSQFLLAATTFYTHTFIIGIQVDAEKFDPGSSPSSAETYLRDTLQMLHGFFTVMELNMPNSNHSARPDVPATSRRSSSVPVGF